MNKSIKHTFRFDYKNCVNKETWECAPLTWKDKDMAGTYAPCYEPVMITAQIDLWLVAKKLVEEGSGSNIL